MATTINQVKQLAVTDTPILFFQCTMPGGDVYYWSSHAVSLNGQLYAARVLKHNLFTFQLAAEDAMDGLSQLSVVLANADGEISELNAAVGFRGSQVTVSLAFVDLTQSLATTESILIFRGVAGDPSEITETTLTLSFTNKLSLQRVAIPDTRIQRTCPWNFPATLAQRQEASNGGEYGRFSKFYRCGYSADVPGGSGNMNGAQAFTSCDKSRAQCLQRGMFNTDNAGNVNNRYGGFEFIPTAYLVRGANDKTSHLSAIIDNTGKANDAVPMVYGQGWLKAPVVFSRNDGNLTHLEVLLGLGPITQLLKVVVNDVEIPAYSANGRSTATGWYALVSNGNRNGSFNLDFSDSNGNPLGDPQGSMAVLSVVVPNAISTGSSTPTVQVLMAGLQLDTYDSAGNKSLPVFTNNPAWVILDVLQRAGWAPSDLNIASFYQSSVYCAESISALDSNGNAINIMRYACNVMLTKRQSAATLVRGVRVGSCLMLRYGADGLLELLPESTLALQQPTPPDGGNSLEPLNGGWAAYEFSDGSAGFSGIARNSHGASSVTLSSAGIAETSNRLSVEFQDENNEYQQDALSVSNSNDSDLIGFEVASASTAIGLPNFNQATRVLLRQLDKSLGGNQYLQFQTSFRALKVRPGDIIAMTYARENFVRTPFRILKLAPSLNYELVTIQAQIHNDDWYSDNLAVLESTGRQPISSIGPPRPLVGTVAHDYNKIFEYFDLALTDTVEAIKDSISIDTITVGFSVPAKPSASATYIPLLSLSSQIDTTVGSLPGGSIWYYAVTAVDSSGLEGPLSFTVPATIPAATTTNSVTLTNLSFPVGALTFNVYRGVAPQSLFLIQSGQPIAATFTDTGLPAQPMGPPDANFDHANFYYRNQYAGPFQADSSLCGANTIGSNGMVAVTNAYQNMVTRIVDGTGVGQERSIVSNTQAILSVGVPWTILPDSSSIFAVSEAAWKLVAISSNSPAQFSVPYVVGGVIQVTGRSANILNQESSADLAPITTIALGDSQSDSGIPATPSFSLFTPGGGEIKIIDIGFADLTNVQSVTSGTLQMFYWNELDTPSQYSLASGIDDVMDNITLTMPADADTLYVGQLIQIEAELLSITSVANSNTYTVARGIANTLPDQNGYSAGTEVLPLASYTVVMPFVAGFFQNRASTNYIHTESIPDIRICLAEFLATNSFGNSQSAVQTFTLNKNLLRTLSGGQFSIQVNGYVATQQNAAPPLVVQASHAVRDIQITLGQPPVGYKITVDVLQNNIEYCQLTYDPTLATPNVPVDGTNLPPLSENAVITLNVTLTLLSTTGLTPGRDLTITIRM